VKTKKAPDNVPAALTLIKGSVCGIKSGPMRQRRLMKRASIKKYTNNKKKTTRVFTFTIAGEMAANERRFLTRNDHYIQHNATLLQRDKRSRNLRQG
jgi:hypothetical protein